MSTEDEMGLPADLSEWVEEMTGWRLSAARRMPGGGRKQAWFVDFERPDGATEALFLRWDPIDPATTGDPWTVRREAEVYRALSDTPVPVARFLASHPRQQAMLATRVSGGNWFSAIKDDDEAQSTAKDFMVHLAALHRLDPHDLKIPGFDPDAPVRDHVIAQLDEMQALIDFRGGHAEAVLQLGLDWLRAHVPAYDGPTVLVQGDTGPGNFMYEHGAVTAIVDWELAHLGDPMDDIAWLTLRAVQEPFTDLRARINEYVSLSGHALDVDRVKYYRVLAEAKIMAMGHGTELRTRAEAAGGGGDIGARLVFGQLHRRLLVEALADVLGLDLPPVKLPADPEPTDVDDMFDIVLDQFRHVIVPRIADTFAVQRTKGMARVLKYLASATRRRASFERDELADLGPVLGAHSPELASVAPARQALGDAIRAGAVDAHAALPVIYRRVMRDNELLREASGALAGRHYLPLPAHPWDRRLGVWHIAEEYPDATAIAASPDGTRTFGQLAGEAHQLVHTFRSFGLEPGDTVAAVMPNGIDIIELSMACQEAGWWYTPLNTFLTATEIADIVEHSGAKLLVVHERFAHLLEGDNVDAALAQQVRTVSIGAVAGVECLDDLRREQPTTMPDNRTTGSLFAYSSGTTGKPKGIRRRTLGGDPSQDAHDGAIFGRAFDFRPFDGPQLVSTAMYHGGSHSYYMGALHVGQSVVIMAKFDAEECLRLIDQHKIRSAYMVPTQFVRLLRLPAEVRARYDVSSLHSVVHSAAPCPRDVKEQMMNWWGPVIWETYGGMEGAATIAKPHRWLEKPGTVGRPVKGVRVFILDDDGTEVPAGTVGQIYMQMPTRFEYHRDAEGTDAAFRGNRHTIGDIGYLDDDGYLFISDRVKDMIITGGVNVYPVEVEAVLNTHPAVDDAAVIGVPDPEWGESVKAVVTLRPGHERTPELAGELLAYCRDKLASYKCPRSVDFRDTLPRTEAGKLYKRQIRDEYWAATGRQV